MATVQPQEGWPLTIRRGGTLVSAEDFDQWLSTGKPGSVFCYATCVWLEERKPHKSSVFLVPEETRTVAKAVWRAYEAGKVEPCQRRNGKQFDYLAIKRREIVPPLKPHSMCGKVR
jgi:hypothetical protein